MNSLSINQMEELITYYNNYKGENLRIKESISSNKRNFDRHFTTFNNFTLTLESVEWRFSGARIMFFGINNTQYEISMDTIEEIVKDDNKYIVYEKLSEQFTRKSELIIEK